MNLNQARMNSSRLASTTRSQRSSPLDDRVDMSITWFWLQSKANRCMILLSNMSNIAFVVICIIVIIGGFIMGRLDRFVMFEYDRSKILQNVRSIKQCMAIPPSKIYPLLDSDTKHRIEAQCEARLSELDQRFDVQRQGRIANIPEDGQYFIRQENRTVYVFDLYEPEAVCFNEERFGTDVRFEAFGDGPKFVCGVDYLNAQHQHNQDPCLVYSVGSNNNIFFERAVKTYLPHCEIHTFDPTMPGVPFKGAEYATFHPWGLGTDGDVVPFTRKEVDMNFTAESFDTVFSKLDHWGKRINILKIDCEGCEYTAMPPLFDAIAEGKIVVDQILIEMHKRDALLPPFFLSMDKAKMRMFHKERNHWGCKGASCVEYAIASESFLHQANKYATCPEVMMK